MLLEAQTLWPEDASGPGFWWGWKVEWERRFRGRHSWHARKQRENGLNSGFYNSVLGTISWWPACFQWLKDYLPDTKTGLSLYPVSFISMWLWGLNFKCLHDIRSHMQPAQKFTFPQWLALTDTTKNNLFGSSSKQEGLNPSTRVTQTEFYSIYDNSVGIPRE